MSWTTDQKKAIEKTNDNVIVTASAGCGKTSTMIERAYNLMKNGTPVRRMTLLTFTEAAAKEMKEKLRKRLYEEMKTVVTAEERAALMEQIDDLPYANISTIHGYCYQLVREFFEQIPLSPSVRIIEEDAANELMYKAFDALIEEKEKLREETGDDSFYDLRMMVNLRKDDDLFDLLKNIYERMTNQPDREKWLWDIYNDEYGVDFENTRLAKYFYALIHDKAVEIRQGVESLVLTIKSEVPKYEKETYWKHVVRLDEYVRKYADATSVKEILAAYREIADEAHRFYPCKPYPNFNLWKEAYVSFLKERVEGVAELGTYEELVKRHMGSAGFVKQLCLLTLEFAALYAKQKKELAVVDFADLELYATKILSDEKIREEIRARHDYVFVDEFQDTNHVQSVIIGYIAPEGRLFVVGDSKQSIYRFREAEPEIFLRLLRTWSAEDRERAITFGRNFRSDRCILSVVNRVFDRLMTEEFGGVDYEKESRFELLEETPFNKDAVQFYFYDNCKEDAEPSTGTYSVKEAAFAEKTVEHQEGVAIANFIRNHLHEKVLIKGKEVYMGYRHFAILLRKRNLHKRIVPTLLQMGIPLNMDTFAGDTGIKDVNVLIALANVLDNAMQDYPLLTVLRSAFGRFSDAELAAIRKASADTYAPYWQAFAAYAKKDDALAERVRKFLENVKRYTFAASFTPLSTLFRDCIVETGYVDYLYAQPDGPERMAALELFIAGIEGKNFGQNLTSFCAYYNKFPVNELKNVSVDASLDRVMVSTIHASKGLEYPAVILPALDDDRSSGGAQSIELDKDLGLGMVYYDKAERTQSDTFAKAVIKLNKSLKENEDRLRLLYVAMTRAQCYLFMTGAKVDLKKNKKTGEKTQEINHFPATTDNFMTWLNYAMDCDPSLRGYMWPYELDYTPASESVKVVDESGKFDDVREDRAYRYENAIKLEKKYTVTALNHRHYEKELPLPSFLEGKEEMQRGTAYHTVFQHISYRAVDADAVKEELARLVDERLLEAEEAEGIDAEKVARCLVLPLMQKVNEESVKTYHELRFVSGENARDICFDADETVLVQGVIDLLMVEDDGLTVVDFKLSSRPDKLAETYRMQLELYAKAAANAFGRKVKACYLVEINGATVIEVATDEAR